MSKDNKTPPANPPFEMTPELQAKINALLPNQNSQPEPVKPNETPPQTEVDKKTSEEEKVITAKREVEKDRLTQAQEEFNARQAQEKKMLLLEKRRWRKARELLEAKEVEKEAEDSASNSLINPEDDEDKISVTIRKSEEDKEIDPAQTAENEKKFGTVSKDSDKNPNADKSLGRIRVSRDYKALGYEPNKGEHPKQFAGIIANTTENTGKLTAFISIHSDSGNTLRHITRNPLGARESYKLKYEIIPVANEEGGKGNFIIKTSVILVKDGKDDSTGKVLTPEQLNKLSDSQKEAIKNMKISLMVDGKGIPKDQLPSLEDIVERGGQKASQTDLQQELKLQALALTNITKHSKGVDGGLRYGMDKNSHWDGGYKDDIRITANAKLHHLKLKVASEIFGLKPTEGKNPYHSLSNNYLNNTPVKIGENNYVPIQEAVGNFLKITEKDKQTPTVPIKEAVKQFLRITKKEEQNPTFVESEKQLRQIYVKEIAQENNSKQGFTKYLGEKVEQGKNKVSALEQKIFDYKVHLVGEFIQMDKGDGYEELLDQYNEYDKLIDINGDRSQLVTLQKAIDIEAKKYPVFTKLNDELTKAKQELTKDQKQYTKAAFISQNVKNYNKIIEAAQGADITVELHNHKEVTQELKELQIQHTALAKFNDLSVTSKLMNSSEENKNQSLNIFMREQATRERMEIEKKILEAGGLPSTMGFYGLNKAEEAQALKKFHEIKDNYEEGITLKTLRSLASQTKDQGLKELATKELTVKDIDFGNILTSEAKAAYQSPSEAEKKLIKNCAKTIKKEQSEYAVVHDKALRVAALTHIRDELSEAKDEIGLAIFAKDFKELEKSGTKRDFYLSNSEIETKVTALRRQENEIRLTALTRLRDENPALETFIETESAKIVQPYDEKTLPIPSEEKINGWKARDPSKKYVLQNIDPKGQDTAKHVNNSEGFHLEVAKVKKMYETQAVNKKDIESFVSRSNQKNSHVHSR